MVMVMVKHAHTHTHTHTMWHDVVSFKVFNFWAFPSPGMKSKMSAFEMNFFKYVYAYALAMVMVMVYIVKLRRKQLYRYMMPKPIGDGED